MILFTFNLCWVYIARHIFRLYARKSNSCQYPLMYCNEKSSSYHYILVL